MKSEYSHHYNNKQRLEQSFAPKKLAKIQFGTLRSDEIQKISELQVTSRDVYQMLPQRMPAQQGCIDPRLGVSDKVSLCKTCRKKLADCAGHFGYIQLELPVFHIGYLRHTLTILQCICKRCSRILLPLGNGSTDRQAILKRLKRSNIKNEDALTKSNIFKKVIEICKRNTICSYCNYANGTVKKVGGSFKIVHEKYRSKQQNVVDHDIINEILVNHPDLKPLTQKLVENVNPVRAYELLCNITEEDMILLWMNGEYGRPESLIMWTVPVPPVPIRPSVPQDHGGSNEDDITIKLQEIIEMNNALKLALEKGATMKMIAEDWEFLQIQVALLINGETPGIPRQLLGQRALRGLCQRLKGKQGRFRGNLSGKRVDFSGRTVISPDPNLSVDQVGIPILVAKTMTYPEKVNRYNIDKLRRMILNGPDVHPGASIVRSMNNNNIASSVSLFYGDRPLIASNLKIGDIVDRHMIDDDFVLFNRQPSLHKQSIMCHRVKVMPFRTFRFNECACTPYNADFDGDEMNIHFPQTEEARAEAGELMQITYNLITPRNGVPLVAATQDFLTGAYLLTQKDVFFNKSDFCRLVAYLSDALEHIDLPPPTIWKPRMLWTGKQVISLLVRPNESITSYVNLESEEKFYSKSDQHFCKNDGYVCFRSGELISGNLGKKTLGGDTKTGLFYVLIRDYGPKEAIRCMSRLAKLCSRFLADRGFSIGIDDVTPSKQILLLKSETLNRGLLDAESQIGLYTTGGIKLKPGCNALQSLESELNGILSKVREKCGDKAVETLPHRNSPLCMANCGSKGSPLNLSQMIACLGQQSVGGSRIQNGFIGRSLPHFPMGSLTPSAKGFVANSFYSGLTATEFFFHTMGGREGLVDTAVKTAETGYMARRLMKALEDLSLQYDSSLKHILDVALKKYFKAIIEPGEAVGAVGAQSLSEPGTQMTLKTFHFAGVASMNVTLGVPRLKEIINASKSISTPIIEARLLQCDSLLVARIVKAKIEKTLLGKHNHKILIFPPDMKENTKLSNNGLNGTIPSHQRTLFTIQLLKNILPNIIVQGIPTVSRAVINEETNRDRNNRKEYHLLVEGYGLSAVLGTIGVDYTSTKTNHIIETESVLGIEASRTAISHEIKYIMEAYGISVDRRHLMLLSDVMTFKGEILGITRFGVAKMKESVLMLASFEKTTDHLFDAAVHSREDSIVGVSECIIMGVPIPIGTGIFKKTKLHFPNTAF
eukprot:gene16810-22294_t